MWETTIIGELGDLIYFALLEDELKNKLDDKVVIAMSLSSRLTCSIALRDKRYLSLLKDSIFECIIKCAKDEYFRENIHILDDSRYNEMLITSLVFVNLQDEINYAKVRVNFPKKIHIRSLIRFKLSKFYFIWEKFVCYINQKELVKGGNTYLCFLKLLASSTQPSSNIMFLEKIRDNMCILDENRKIVAYSPSDDEIGMVVSLVALAPKKIIINCVNTISFNVLELINYIFEDRISLLL